MELKDFIKNTISSISEAIVESQAELEGKGVIINPEKVVTDKDGKKLLRNNGERYIQNLDFDILIAADEKQGVDGGGKLTVAGLLSVGGTLTDETANSINNRIKFTIPVAFSTSKTPDDYQHEVFTGQAI